MSEVDGWGTRVARYASGARADVSLATIEAILIVLAYSAALSMRFMDSVGTVPSVWWTRLILVLPIIMLVHIGSNVVFGNYGHVWKYASIDEAVRLLAASMTAGFVLLSGLLIWHRTGLTGAERPIPVSVLVVGVLLTLGGMGALRFWSRMFSFRRFGDLSGTAQRALVVGVGEDAVHLARHRSTDLSSVFVVGFIEPDPDAPVTKRRLSGLPVLGGLGDVADLVEAHGIDQVIVATSDADVLSRELVDLCMSVEVRLRILPDIASVLKDESGTRDIRDLELTDLLPRQSVRTDLAAVERLIAGKTVLVTGAGGSIGSELVRQILDFSPARVVALDHDETHLHDAIPRWQGAGPDRFILELADIRDEERTRALFDRHRPDVVFHAAAHKHVPILERCPSEAAKTNVVGTDIVVQAATDFGADNLVMISTDKAVDPVSVMGASKRMAEMLVQVASRRPGGLRLSAVRFGNVLGSRGSVVPTFTRQIKEGGPVTVSDPEMERYFMTVDEAVQLVLQAAALSRGGEVYVLDMGEPVRIVDLAHRLIRLSGLVPDKDIEVRITGSRPGERLTEHLSIEPLQPTAHEKILMAHPAAPEAATMAAALDRTRDLIGEADEQALSDLFFDMGRARWDQTEVEHVWRQSTTA